MTTREQPREVTATELQRDYARVIRDAEYGRLTTVTRNGKTVAQVAPPDAVIVPTGTPDGPAVLVRMRKFADELRDYTSPHGISANYADRLEEILNEIEGKP